MCSDLLLCTQLFISFDVFFYLYLSSVYVLWSFRLHHQGCCKKSFEDWCSYSLNICWIVACEWGVCWQCKWLSSPESLDLHLLFQSRLMNPHPNFSSYLHMHKHMTGTVTFMFHLICENLLEIWQLWGCCFPWVMGWESYLRKHCEREMFKTKQFWVKIGWREWSKWFAGWLYETTLHCHSHLTSILGE